MLQCQWAVSDGQQHQVSSVTDGPQHQNTNRFLKDKSQSPQTMDTYRRFSGLLSVSEMGTTGIQGE